MKLTKDKKKIITAYLSEVIEDKLSSTLLYDGQLMERWFGAVYGIITVINVMVMSIHYNC